MTPALDAYRSTLRRYLGAVDDALSHRLRPGRTSDIYEWLGMDRNGRFKAR